MDHENYTAYPYEKEILLIWWKNTIFVKIYCKVCIIICFCLVILKKKFIYAYYWNLQLLQLIIITCCTQCSYITANPIWSCQRMRMRVLFRFPSSQNSKDVFSLHYLNPLNQPVFLWMSSVTDKLTSLQTIKTIIFKLFT